MRYNLPADLARPRRPYQAKLTDDEVRIIVASDESQRALGERYGMDHRAIGRIRQRRTYKHVTLAGAFDGREEAS